MRKIILIFILISSFVSQAFAVNYPVTTPAGEQPGGWFQTYFDNMYTTPCGASQFLNGFTLSGVLLCSTPGIYITGVLGQTLYYDGTDWVVSSNIWNNNTNVGIGTSTPGAKLDVNGDALVNSLTIGRGGASIASNTALGYQALISNLTGLNNVGIGYQALTSNVAGFSNTAGGYRSLANTTGNNNTALGFESLVTNISGVNNSAIGTNSMFLNTIGSYNTALGYGSLGALTSGDYNIAIGYNADVPSAGGSGQLSIGNWIYGSGGKIGIGTGALSTSAILKVAGQIEITGGFPGIGKVLTSDANGLASWTGAITATALSITGSVLGSTMYFDGVDWVASTNVYNANANVGIGTATPGAKLEVAGQVKITGGGVASGRILTSDALGLAYWADPGAATTVAASGVIAGYEAYVPYFGTGGNGLYASVLYQTGGNMGIGTTTPGAKLEVAGQVKITGGIPGVGKILTSDAVGLASWGSPSIATTVYATGVIGAYGSGGYITQFMPFGTGISSSIMYQSGSFIGIGNTNPLYGLDITGTFRALSNAVFGGTIQIQGGSPGAGKYLMSDALGNASWSAVSASTVFATGVIATASSGGYLTKFIAGGTGITSSLLFESGSFIGIGNTNPGYSLDITGNLRTTSSILAQGALNASGATTLGSSLGVVGATSLQNLLTVVGATSLQSTLSVSGNTLLAGTIQIQGGTPGLGKLLMSDANGLATWTTFASGSTATGITGGSSGYLSVFGNGGVGLFPSRLFQTGLLMGIGTATPGYTLDIAGTGAFTGLRLTTGSASGYVLTSDTTGNARWTNNTPLATNVYATGVLGSAGSGGYFTKFMANGSGITSALAFESGSFIGIGNTNPGYNLDVNGTSRTTGNALIGGTLQISGGSPGLGKFLISDASGLASWTGLVTATSLNFTGSVAGSTLNYDGTSWVAGTNIFNTGTNVGIGTSTPAYKLDITGNLRTTSSALVQGTLNASGATNLGSTLTVIGASSLQNSLSVSGNTLLAGTLQISGGSPGLNKVLTSDASGLASWASGTVTIDNIFGGTAGYISRFATGGAGIMNSSLFESGGRLGLGNNNPQATFQVTGSGIFTNDLTVQGKLITDTIINRTVSNVSISGSILPDTSAPLTYRDIGNDTTQSWNNLYLSGQVKIKGGTPGLGKILTSDALGLASWSSIFNGTMSSTGITGGSSGYLSVFGNGGNGLFSSNIFQTGAFIGIGTSTPSYSLDNSGTFRTTGNGLFQGLLNVSGATVLGSTVQILGGSPGLGKLLMSDASGNATWTTFASGSTATGITGGSSGYLSVFGNGGVGLFASRLFQSGVFIGIGTAIPAYSLDVLGTGSFNGLRLSSGAALGRYLTTDANGNASWSGIITAGGLSISGSVLGSTLYYNGSAWTAGTGLYNTGGNIGIGTITPGSKLTIDSGSGGTTGLRFSQVTSTSAVISTNIIGLGIDGSGNVVPISNGDVIVYDGISTGDPTPNPDNANREIGYDFNKFFNIPAKQSFVVTDGTNPGQSAPYIAPNGASSICEWTGTYGTGVATCPTTDAPGSPYNSFTMSARGLGGIGYQMGIAYRGDVPIMARAGYFRGGYGSGLYLGAASSTPAPWFKVFTVPTNHIEYFYIDTGYTGRFAATGRDGRIGIGTVLPDTLLDVRGTANFYGQITGSGTAGVSSSPTYSWSGDTNVGIYRPATDTIGLVTSGVERMRIDSTGNVAFGYTGTISSNFEVWSGASTIAHMRGTDSIGFGLNAARYQASGNANSAFGDEALRTDTTGYSNTAIGNASLYSNQTGFFNSALGTQSLYTNSDGTWNVAIGSQSLYTNLSGDYNVSIGGQSLYLNSSGNDSVALGYLALRATTNGYNIGIGSEAGSGITTGTGNIMIGYRVQANSNTYSNQLNIGNWIYGSGGNIGIGVANPASKLEVNGTFDLGTNGTQLAAIIKATVVKDLPSIAATSCSAQTFTVTNAQTTGSVVISPVNALTDRLFITYARVSAASTVEAKFCNESAAAIDMASMNFYITVIQ